RVGADRRDVDHARAVLGRRARDRTGAFGLHRLEALRAAFEQDADQVDDDVGLVDHRVDRAWVADVGLEGVDLADPAERLQMTGQFGAAHRDADAVVALGERPDHVPAEEAGAPEDGDERVEVRRSGHAAVSPFEGGSVAEYRIVRDLYRGGIFARP